MEEFTLHFIMGLLPLHISNRPVRIDSFSFVDPSDIKTCFPLKLAIALDHMHAMQSDSNEMASRFVDRSIRCMARAVVDDLPALFKETIISANVSLVLAETASITASSVLTQLDSELSRVRLVIANTPWWKSWTWEHWLYRSELTISKQYLKQLLDEEAHIRYHADGVLAVRHNLQLLVYYIKWYTGYIVSVISVRCAHNLSSSHLYSIRYIPNHINDLDVALDLLVKRSRPLIRRLAPLLREPTRIMILRTEYGSSGIPAKLYPPRTSPKRTMTIGSLLPLFFQL